MITRAGGFPMKVMTADPYLMATSSKTRIDHANTGETSVSMRLIPQLVNMDAKIGPDILSGNMPFVKKGMPSSEAGNELVAMFLDEAVVAIEKEYRNI